MTLDIACVVNSLEKGIKGSVACFLQFGILGNKISIDASSLCQLRCPICSHAKGEQGIIGRGCLRFADFKKFVDRYPYFRIIELSNRGEIFLNPELEKIIKYAYDKHIVLIANNGVNFNSIDKEMLKDLV